MFARITTFDVQSDLNKLSRLSREIRICPASTADLSRSTHPPVVFCGNGPHCPWRVRLRGVPQEAMAKWARLPLGHNSLSSYMTQSPSSHQPGPFSSLTRG
jgi:hypothetical protein